MIQTLGRPKEHCPGPQPLDWGCQEHPEASRGQALSCQLQDVPRHTPPVANTSFLKELLNLKSTLHFAYRPLGPLTVPGRRGPMTLQGGASGISSIYLPSLRGPTATRRLARPPSRRARASSLGSTVFVTLLKASPPLQPRATPSTCQVSECQTVTAPLRS